MASLRYIFNNGKNNKIKYYALSYLRYIMPKSIYRAALEPILKRFDNMLPAEQEYILDRVNYYCKLPTDKITPLSPKATRLGDHTLSNRKGYQSPYFFDSYEFTRYFDDNLRWSHLFGDITHVPATPMIVKSRPLHVDNTNSVMLKLNKNRHFVHINDSRKFDDKRDMAIFRGDILGKSARRDFVAQYIDHPMCDIGDVSRHSNSPAEWRREPMTIYDQLRNKFVFALEGNDVASNLKWIMSSNSLAVMPKPTCETWFMEGRLTAGEHFVEIASDFSNIEDRLQYYLDHPKESMEIIHSANQFVSQFANRDREGLISLLVLLNYFERTGQLPQETK